MVAVWKELEDALFRVVGMASQLLAMEVECGKAEATTKSSANASVAHLEQVQEVSAMHECKLWFPCFVLVCLASSAFCLLCFRFPLTFFVYGALAKNLAVDQELSTKGGEARERFGANMSRAAQELGVTLDLGTTFTKHLFTLMAVEREWI